MKTETVVVSTNGQGMEAALAQTDKLAEQLGLSGKDALHLHLLAEEMMNMVRSIIHQPEAKYWVEGAADALRLHLQTTTLMDAEQRAKLLAASTSGKNEAHRGIMGKIRAFFEPMPIDETPAYLANAIVASDNGDLTWSMDDYRESLRRNKDVADGAREEWDELEKSLVSHLADNVQVSIRGYNVDLVIVKKLA